MKDTIRRFRPATSWFTTGMLTLVIATFGVFAQTHAREQDTSLATVTTSICSHALQRLGVCNDGAVDSIISQKIHYR
jgi:hypothetical protein